MSNHNENYYVSVNSVIVGKLTSIQMASISKEVQRDWRIWLLQIGSVCQAVMTFVHLSISALVTVCVLGTLLFAYSDSLLFSHLLGEMTRSPVVVESALSLLLKFWGIVCGLMLVVSIATQKTFGLLDYSSIAVATKIRQELDVAAVGVVRWWPESRKD